MKTSLKNCKILIIPLFYILFYFCDFINILFRFLFSDLSISIYKLVYFKKNSSLIIKPLDDFLIFYSLCWLFVLTIICSLFYFFKTEILRKGVYITLFIHICFFAYFVVIVLVS